MTLPSELKIAGAVTALLIESAPAKCSHIFLQTIGAFGVDTYACGEVDLAAMDRSVFYAIAWPATWRDFYLKHNLVSRDPVVEALRYRRLPFTWSELRLDRKLSQAGTEAMQLLFKHGWTEGLVVPIPRGDLRFGLVSMACQRPAFDDQEKALLTVLSLCFHERVRALAPKGEFPVPPAGLTVREIAVLQLIARGKTDGDIAEHLRISKATAHEHFEKAKKKLKVSTRAEAIAIAVSLSIVSP